MRHGRRKRPYELSEPTPDLKGRYRGTVSLAGTASISPPSLAVTSVNNVPKPEEDSVPADRPTERLPRLDSRALLRRDLVRREEQGTRRSFARHGSGVTWRRVSVENIWTTRRSERDAPSEPYRGPDRRGVVGRGVLVNDRRSLALLTVGLVGTPLVGVVVLALVPSGSPTLHDLITGVADTSFVSLVAAALLLTLRWRLVGEVAAASLAVAALLLGLFVASASTYIGAPDPTYILALRALTVVSVLAVALHDARSPETRADLHPSSALIVAALPLFLALPIAFSPARLLVTGSLGGVHPIGIVEVLACLATAGLLLRKGIRLGRLLFVATGTLVLGAALTCVMATVSYTNQGEAWTGLPALVLLAGAVALLAAVAADLRAAIHVVVRHDTRGRRRWEEAETQLALWQKIRQGQAHDMSNALSAVDGTLLSLQRGRDRLSSDTVDRLTAAVRDQIDWLRTLLAGQDGPARRYDVTRLLSALVDLRQDSSPAVHLHAEEGIEAYGHPDRVAVVVNNILVNAAVHSSSASVKVTARLAARRGSDVVEIVVSDRGQGLCDADRAHALQRGWRGADAAGSPGSGLGLYQCSEMLSAEGGVVYLLPTDSTARPGAQGLSVHVELPTGPDATEPLHDDAVDAIRAALDNEALSARSS
ncbi:MAG: sensor histidine kinase [Acidimicrobiales bacterium]